MCMKLPWINRKKWNFSISSWSRKTILDFSVSENHFTVFSVLSRSRETISQISRSCLGLGKTILQNSRSRLGLGKPFHRFLGLVSVSEKPFYRILSLGSVSKFCPNLVSVSSRSRKTWSRLTLIVILYFWPPYC